MTPTEGWQIKKTPHRVMTMMLRELDGLEAFIHFASVGLDEQLLRAASAETFFVTMMRVEPEVNTGCRL